jgi:hypothetical protein
VALVRTEVPEEGITSLISVEGTRHPGTTLAVISSCNCVPLKASVLTRATQLLIPEDDFFIVTAVKTSNLT